MLGQAYDAHADQAHLQGQRFDAETARLLSVAFALALVTLHRADEVGSTTRDALAQKAGATLRRSLEGNTTIGPGANQRPQSSSASRFTAGASGFLNLSQSGDRPDL
jgi:hypothetical protein